MSQPVPTAALDDDAKIVATPEGDNEFAPDQPLAPTAVDGAVDGLEAPRGNAPQPYDNDRPVPVPPHVEKHDPPTGLEKFIDEISHGTLMP